MSVVLIIAAVLAVSCLVLGGLALFFFVGVPTIDEPQDVSVSPGFSGPLAGRWRAQRGGFTGVQTQTPLSSELGDRWPPGAAIELLLEADGTYTLTLVRANSGTPASRALAREEGSWRQQGGMLVVEPTSGTLVSRLGPDRSERPLSTTPRRYQLSTVTPTAGGTARLRLEGPALEGFVTIDGSWDLEGP